MKHIGVDITDASEKCRLCLRTERFARRDRRRDTTEICETSDPDGCWHIRRRDAKKTYCGQDSKETSPYVRQGVYSLLVLKNDVGACEGCRDVLVEIFAEALN